MRPWDWIKKLVLGGGKNVRDPGTFHRMALIAFFAWVELGADGLSSSNYGPQEAFLSLGDHRHLAFYLAVMTALTVITISLSYSQIIELFPTGGGAIKARWERSRMWKSFYTPWQILQKRTHPSPPNLSAVFMSTAALI